MVMDKDRERVGEGIEGGLSEGERSPCLDLTLCPLNDLRSLVSNVHILAHREQSTLVNFNDSSPLTEASSIPSPSHSLASGLRLDCSKAQVARLVCLNPHKILVCEVDSDWMAVEAGVAGGGY